MARIREAVKRRRRRTSQQALRMHRLQIERATSLMDEVLRVRSTPLPSEALVEAAGVDYHSDEAIMLTAPHWNAAVRMLGQDGAGYGLLLDLVAQLEGHLHKVRIAINEAKQKLHGADMMIGILKAEARGGMTAEEHTRAWWLHPGASATLRESLGWPSPATEDWDPPRSWRWVRADPTDLLHQDAHLYYEVEPKEPSAWTGMKVPEAIRFFHADDTWEEAVREVEWVRRGRAEEVDRLTGTVETILFRVTIVRQVRKEFELLGGVGPFKPSRGAYLRQLTHNEVTFVREAYRLMEELPDYYTSRKRVLDDVRAELDWQGRIDVRGVATAIGAYRSAKGMGKGSTGRTTHKEEFKHFRKTIGAYYDRYGPGEGSVNRRREAREKTGRDEEETGFPSPER